MAAYLKGMRIDAKLFSGRDLTRLRQAMKSVADKRIFVRLEAIWMVACGKSIKEVAELLAKSRQAVYNWVVLYVQTRNPFALGDHPRSGRPSAASPITAERIARALDLQPASLGYQAGAWTVALLAHYLGGRYGCAIAPHTLRRRMKQMGLRYKRPRYVYEEKDPNRAQKKGLSYES